MYNIYIHIYMCIYIYIYICIYIYTYAGCKPLTVLAGMHLHLHEKFSAPLGVFHFKTTSNYRKTLPLKHTRPACVDPISDLEKSHVLLSRTKLRQSLFHLLPIRGRLPNGDGKLNHLETGLFGCRKSHGSKSFS